MAGAVRLKGNVTAQLEIAWDGASYVDETANLKRFAVTRGYSADQTSIDAGTCALTLKETIGRYNPANTGSAIYPYISYPLRPMRLRVTYASTTYYLFSGFTTRHESDPGRDSREARIDCVDAFVLLGGDGGNKPVIASSGTTTGAAIAAILTAAGFGGTTDLDTGDTITFAADGTTDGLSLIGDLLETERGFFFMTASGVATYFDRYWTNRSPYNASQGTIASTMRSITPAADLALVRNRATVTATGGTAQTASNAASIALFKTRDFDPIDSPYLASDAAALSLASYLVTQAKDPLPPVRQIDIGQHDAATFTQLLTRELGDQVTVSESIGGTSGAYHIRRIELEGDWSAGVLQGSWSLRQRTATGQPFIVGISSVGGPDLITY
jgi:hypothetical protein